jgi:hypothetical protein
MPPEHTSSPSNIYKQCSGEMHTRAPHTGNVLPRSCAQHTRAALHSPLLARDRSIRMYFIQVSMYFDIVSSLALDHTLLMTDYGDARLPPVPCFAPSMPHRRDVVWRSTFLVQLFGFYNDMYFGQKNIVRGFGLVV